MANPDAEAVKTNANAAKISRKVDRGMGELLVAGCWLQVVSCKLQVASCQLSVVSCQLSVVGCRLPVVGCRLPVAVASG
jgi:hypothetical protein